MNQFENDIEKIGNVYEATKDCLYALEFDKTLTKIQKKIKFNAAMRGVQELRDLACTALRQNHDSSEN